MTHPQLVKIENLVRRLEEAINNTEDGVEKTLFSLASEYAEHCKRANDRLQVCAEIASKGKDMEYQALMTATRAPDLLDLCAILSELQTDEWRSFCRRNHLPVPDQLQESSKQLIDPLYAKAGTFQRKLMEEYSAANSKRDFREALKVIRQATKLNPSDSNSVTQAQRLEDRLVREAIKTMELPLKNGDVAGVLGRLEDIEGLAPGRQPKEGEASERLWIEALELRRGVRRDEAIEESEELMAEAEVAWQEKELNEVLDLISRVSALMEEHEFTLRPDLRELHKEIGRWADGEVLKLKIEDKFRSKLSGLRESLKTIKDKELQSTKPTLSEYREDSFLIQRQWVEIVDFRKPVPVELQDDAQKLLGELNEKIALKETAKRRTLILGISTGSLLLIACAIVSVFFWKAGQLRGQLARSVEERRANDLERKIGEIESNKPIWFIFSGLPGEVERGKSWLEIEKSNALRVTELIKVLDQDVRSKANPVEWTASSLSAVKVRLDGAKTEAAAVNEDYRSDMLNSLAVVDREWLRIVDTKRNEIVAKFHEHVLELELRVREKLGFDQAPIALNQEVTETAKLITEMDVLAQPELEELKPSLADLPKYETNKEKFGKIKEIWEQGNVVMVAAREADNLDDYLKAMKNTAETGIFKGPQLKQLLDLQLKVQSADSVLMEILMPGNLSLWTRLKSGNFSSQGYPASLEGDETVQFLSLRDDESLGEMFQYAVTVNGVTRSIYSQGTQMTIRPSRLGDVEVTEASGVKVYDPARGSSSVASFEPANYRHTKSPVGASGILVKDGRRCPESELFGRIKLPGFVDASVASYRNSLLKAIDRLMDANDEVNPLYKAYLHIKLGELMMKRKDKWLTEFSDFEKDFSELKGIVDRELTSNDWLIPSIVSEYREPLAEYYKKHKGTQYEKTGLAVYQFYERMIAGGMGYCGFVDVKQGLELVNPTEEADTLWGYDKSLKIVRVFRKNAAGGWDPQGESAPFTPVFYLKRAPDEVLKSVTEALKVDPDSPDFRKRLPVTLFPAQT